MDDLETLCDQCYSATKANSSTSATLSHFISRPTVITTLPVTPVSASSLSSNDDSGSTVASGHDFDAEDNAVLQARVEELEALIRLHHTAPEETGSAEYAQSDLDVDSAPSATGAPPRPTLRISNQRQQRPTHTMTRSATADSLMLPSSVSSSSDGGGRYYDPIEEDDYDEGGNAIDYDHDEYDDNDNQGRQPQQMDEDDDDEDDDETQLDNYILSSIASAARRGIPSVSTAPNQAEVFKVPEARTIRDLQDPVVPKKDLSVQAPNELRTHLYVKFLITLTILGTSKE